jgi:hypothetical protein
MDSEPDVDAPVTADIKKASIPKTKKVLLDDVRFTWLPLSEFSPPHDVLPYMMPAECSSPANSVTSVC